MPELFPENSKNAQQVDGARRTVFLSVNFLQSGTDSISKGSEAKCLIFLNVKYVLRET